MVQAIITSGRLVKVWLLITFGSVSWYHSHVTLLHQSECPCVRGSTSVLIQIRHQRQLLQRDLCQINHYVLLCIIGTLSNT